MYWSLLCWYYGKNDAKYDGLSYWSIDWLCTFNHCSFDCLYSNIAFERGLFGDCDFGFCGNCTYPSAKYGNHKWSGRVNGIPKLTTFPLLFVCAVIAILVVCNFTHSAPGRACLSIREDEIASEAMGINTTKYKVIAFVIGALLASLAGALFACNFYVIKPDQFTFNKSIDILVMVVFGGMGSMTSSVLAAVAIGIINVILANFSEIRMIIYGLALVGIMIFKPTGILGTKELSFKKLFDKRKEKSA